MRPYFEQDGITIYAGSCLEVLPQLPAGSVHMCVTSPPYWGLRDYGVTGQIGLEATPGEYVANIVAVFREVKRVLRDDGTVWLNLGDCYNAGRNGGWPGGKKQWKDERYVERSGPNAPGLKPKDLVGIPWRVAFALQADGFYLRSDIIWHKPNPMPESVTDRPTKAHEYVFLLSRSAQYFYDQDAIREPHKPESIERALRPWHGNPTRDDPTGGKQLVSGGRSEDAPMNTCHPNGRNCRTVWTIATQSYPGSHFATFPEALVEPCILAGTSERGCCPECGKLWERVTERTKDWRETAYDDNGQQSYREGSGNRRVRPSNGGMSQSEYQTIGWRPTCQHDLEPIPCTVLDPFSGSGTTGRVAVKHRRRYIGIELKAEYIELDRADNTQVALGV